MGPLLPALGLPVLLAYAVCCTFQSQPTFYGILALAAFAGAVFYSVAIDSATTAVKQRKESLRATLGQGTGPVGR
jgi:hypothetical protein